MVITLEELGKRFELLRALADLSQDEVAEKIGRSQNLYNRLANGKGGSINLLLDLVNFYRPQFNMDHIFAQDFHEDLLQYKPISPLTMIAVERLKLLQEETSKEMQNVIDLFKES